MSSCCIALREVNSQQQQHNSLPSPTNPRTILLSLERGEKEKETRGIWANMAEVTYTGLLLLLLSIKKNGTFLDLETIPTNAVAACLKEKGKYLPHIPKQKYRHNFFDMFKTLHALHCLLCI